ncbi:MAG: hypothetical protein QW724_07075 [Nitrososphaerota archaeon]
MLVALIQIRAGKPTKINFQYEGWAINLRPLCHYGYDPPKAKLPPSIRRKMLLSLKILIRWQDSPQYGVAKRRSLDSGPRLIVHPKLVNPNMMMLVGETLLTTK